MHRALVVSLFTPLLFAQAPAGPQELFDGKTLQGWRGDAKVWSVRDGCITGSTVGHKIAANTFLIWEGGDVADFELRAEVKLVGDNNSGVQYRSRVLTSGTFSCGGYQCDVHPAAEYLGMLYEERGAGILCKNGQFVARDQAGAVRVVGTLGKPEARDLTHWHALHIVARGNLMWHEIDGVVVAVVQDDAATAPREGVLALQTHAGSEMTVSFRNLQLTRLPKEELAKVLPPVVASLLAADKQRAAGLKWATPQWIWDASPQATEEVFFRRTFALAAVPDTARLAVSCDNRSRVYVNGQRVIERDEWEVPAFANVGRLLRAGDNVIAVHGTNEGGPAGLVLSLSWSSKDGKGEAGEIVTDASWRCHNDDPDGWDAAAFDATKWQPVKVLAALGAPDAPWTGALGEDAFGSSAPADAPQVAVPAVGLSGPMAADAVKLLSVPRAYGSWVCLAVDDKGRLYASDQARGLYRIVPAKGVGAVTTTERIDVDLGGCHGLCWFRGALYASVNGRQSGLYRVTDTNGDDQLDKVELLRALEGSGEHGPHAIVPAPDGENLLVMCGNHTKVPELAGSRVPTNWGEDRLMQKIEDPNGHAVGIKAPGGYVCLVDPEGKRWEMYCCGFRNAYDMAVLANGAIVTYDSDMEWDMGLPWYRPTRLYQVLSGVDYGWRSGTSTWPTDYPEAPPALADVGPGSPTGLVAIGNEVLALDWTFGTVYGFGAKDGQGGLEGALSTQLTGVPLPVADIVAAGDSCFVLTGGRGIPSTLLMVRNPSVSSVTASNPTALAQLAKFESGHGRIDEAAIAAAFAQLGRRDAVSTAARTTIESQPPVTWRHRALAALPGQPGASLMGLLALARSGEQIDLQPLLDALGKFTFADLTLEHRIWWLRTHALALLRLGPSNPAQHTQLAQRLLPLFPANDDRVDAELAELLAYVDAPDFLAKAVPMLSPLRPQVPPSWTEVATRNANYGGVINKMLANMPPTAQIAIANALRTVKHGWTLDQRRAYFAFLGQARKCKGNASYDGYLKAFIDEGWAACSTAEQHALADLVGKAKADLPKFLSTPPKGPGRDWQLADADARMKNGFADADLAAGHNLFHAIGCASCHYFAGEGGNHGPDLTSLGNKFTAADVLEAILDPSKVISDQYSGSVVTKRDGSSVFGRATKVQHEGAASWEVVPAVADAVPLHIPVADVATVEPSKLSPMPADLVDRLSPTELRNLMAFLLSRGQGLVAPK